MGLVNEQPAECLRMSVHIGSQRSNLVLDCYSVVDVGDLGRCQRKAIRRDVGVVLCE